MRRWIHFARSWGYGGFTAVTLHSLRTSSPAECRAWAQYMDNGPDWHARDLIRFGNLLIRVREARALAAEVDTGSAQVCATKQGPRAALVIACWGAGAWDASFVDDVLEEITTGEAPWPDVSGLGLTAQGAPVHPMAWGWFRIPDDAQPIMWIAKEQGGGHE